MVIVGNKLDRQASERAVSVEEGSSLAEEFDASHLEISVTFSSFFFLFFSVCSPSLRQKKTSK